MTQTETSCSFSYKLVIHILDCLGLLLIIVLQGSILDYYLILHNGGNAAWYFWFLADFLILISFMAAAVISYRHFQKKDKHRKPECIGKRTSSSSKFPCKLGSLPLLYTVWFVYACLLTAKVVLLFKLDVAQSLETDSAFGPQLLKVIIASAAVVFLLLVETHNCAEPNTDYQAYIYFLITSTVFEIFDSVTFLGILFPMESKIVLTFGLENAILGLSCINFILPTLTLYKLSLSEFGQQPRSLGLKLLYKILHLSLVNIPYFSIRVYLWTLYDHDVTLFLLKNILAVIVTARTIVPEVKAWWHSVQTSSGQRRLFVGKAMELGAMYEIPDNQDEGSLPPEEKKELHSTEL